MRKITQQAAKAFENSSNFKSSNTEVETVNGVTSLFLHGNEIATKSDKGLYISTCGWETNTTKERLNGLSGVHVTTKNYQLYLNGQKWDGKKIKVQ